MKGHGMIFCSECPDVIKKGKLLHIILILIITIFVIIIHYSFAEEQNKILFSSSLLYTGRVDTTDREIFVAQIHIVRNDSNISILIDSSAYLNINYNDAKEIIHSVTLPANPLFHPMLGGLILSALPNGKVPKHQYSSGKEYWFPLTMPVINDDIYSVDFELTLKIIEGKTTISDTLYSRFIP